jgi:hypothetical protein
MSLHATIHAGGAAGRPGEPRSPNFGPSNGVWGNLCSAFVVMLLRAKHVFCVLTPCTPSAGCHLNNVNSATAGPECCLVYGVEQIPNE